MFVFKSVRYELTLHQLERDDSHSYSPALSVTGDDEGQPLSQVGLTAKIARLEYSATKAQNFPPSKYLYRWDFLPQGAIKRRFSQMNFINAFTSFRSHILAGTIIYICDLSRDHCFVDRTWTMKCLYSTFYLFLYMYVIRFVKNTRNEFESARRRPYTGTVFG